MKIILLLYLQGFIPISGIGVTVLFGLGSIPFIEKLLSYNNINFYQKMKYSISDFWDKISK